MLTHLGPQSRLKQIAPALSTVGLVLAGLLLAAPSAAQPVSELLFSPDISVTIGAVPFDDEDVAFEDFATPISPFPAPPLASNVDLSAYHVDVAGNGSILFAVDITTEVAGPLTIDPRKIVEWDGASFAVAYDTASLGVPGGVRIDALSVEPASGDYVVSFDTTVAIGSTVFDDEDLVRLGASSASLHFDGGAAGLSPALDVDGASLLVADWITISLDTSGVVAGIPFDDEDILLHHPTVGSWYMAYDASAWASEMQGGPDSNAIFVPEPSVPLLLLAGIAGIAAASRFRQRCRARARVFVLLVPILALFISMPVLASDGLLEINDTCAVQTGCFAGDTPGYPVTLNGTASSYRLTSNLVLPDPNTTGILIQGAPGGASVDLNGFLIGRPTSWAPGTGDGIAIDTGAQSPIEGIRVRNGMVFGAGRHGLSLGDDSVVENVTARHNGDHGIEVGDGSIVRDSVSSDNGGDGISAGNGANILQNAARMNVGSGIYTRVGSMVSGNTTYMNQTHGIVVGTRAIITGNNASLNQGYGLYGTGGVGGNSTYRDNMISSNSMGAVTSAPVIGGVMIDLGGNYCTSSGTCP